MFTLGTRCTRITRELGSRDPDAALDAVADAVEDWSGGTRLGEGLRTFNERWGLRGLARGAVVVILSDGWDRGDPEVLAEQVRRLHRVAHRVVWVNPLKASPGFAPAGARHGGGVAVRGRAGGGPLARVARSAVGGDRQVRDLLRDLARWHAQGKAVAWARVIDLEGSGPRDPGAAMAVSAQGEVIGSVSGGCVEGAVVTEALDVLATGTPRLVSFGYSDDDAFAVGLTCGGTVHLYIEPFSGVPELEAAIRDHRPAVLATIVDGTGVGDALLLVEGSEPRGGLANADLQRVVQRDAEAALAAGTTSVRRYGDCGEANEDVGHRVHRGVRAAAAPAGVRRRRLHRRPRPRGQGARLPRHGVRRPRGVRHQGPVPARRRGGGRLAQPLPRRGGASLGPRDAVCVLTHDAKFDVPAIVAALETKVGYLGAMGSRRTTEQRAERLRAEGVTDEQLDRLMAPIGLDLGARTPEETAVAICAEIIAHRTGRSAPRLSDGTGPIH